MLEVRFGAGGEVPCRESPAHSRTPWRSGSARGPRGPRASVRAACRPGSSRRGRTPGSGGAAGGSRRRRGCARRPRSRAAPRSGVSSRPGSATSCAACGSTSAPRNASAAAAARARLLLPATTTSRAPFARASSSHSGSPSTTVQPGCTTASFSAAIASRVSPSTSMWSSATFVSTTTRVRRTFVASWRPPSPASTTATSTLRVRELRAAPPRSRPRTASRRRHAGGRARRRARSRPRRRRRESARSSPRTCGERYAPTRSPASASSSSVIRVVVDLPFVPTTWTAS